MTITRSTRPIAAARLDTLVRRLLSASTLCAIATVSPGNRPHVNTAYFAWSRDLDILWLSEPGARHSRNLRKKATASIAVYDSNQRWGNADRGVQLFGAAREVVGPTARDAEHTYATRFPRYDRAEVGAYRFYRFRPRRVKLFDEEALGAGVFVTASVRAGQIAWKQTEIYDRSS